jgi:SAM-dependent methyltransferase
MDDPAPKVARILSLAERHNPGATSLLELGCGTGTMLEGLGRLGRLTGIDRSPEMLAIARAKVPTARLLEADITEFDLGARFDVVICVFDTINHVTSFDGWRALFRCAHEHLEPGGIFIFDVNTPAKLHGLAGYGPWFDDVNGVTVAQNVDAPLDGVSRWNVWIVEPTANGGYSGHHEPIGELAVELPEIEAALAPMFELLDAEDEDGETPGPASERVHYAWRRLG